MATSPADPLLVQAAIRSYERTTDLQYVQLLLAILIVILVMYWVGCQYGAIPGVAPAPQSSAPTTPAPSSGSAPATSTAGGNPPKKETFAPYASILTPDIERSDTQFDRSDRSVFPKAFDQRSSENMLFNGIHATQLLTPLY